MGYATVFMILVMNFIIQSTILQHFRILGILPNTALIFVVIFSILWGKNKGIVIGIFTGLLQDILLGSMIGANALTYMLVGYTIGCFESTIFKDSYLTPVFFTIISTIIYHIIFYFIMFVINSKVNILFLLQKVLFVECFYNAILSIFIYKIVYRLSRHPNFRIKTR